MCITFSNAALRWLVQGEHELSFPFQTESRWAFFPNSNIRVSCGNFHRLPLQLGSAKWNPDLRLSFLKLYFHSRKFFSSSSGTGMTVSCLFLCSLERFFFQVCWTMTKSGPMRSGHLSCSFPCHSCGQFLSCVSQLFSVILSSCLPTLNDFHRQRADPNWMCLQLTVWMGTSQTQQSQARLSSDGNPEVKRMWAELLSR